MNYCGTWTTSGVDVPSHRESRRRWASVPTILLLLTCLLSVAQVVDADTTILRGVPAVCENEGERVEVPLISRRQRQHGRRGQHNDNININNDDDENNDRRAQHEQQQQREADRKQNCGWSCSCKNRQIVCEKERCRSNRGCHMVLLEPQRDKKCCSVCKGCVYNGTEYESGSRWKDTVDPCRTYECQAGIVTVSREQCFTPCAHPTASEGQCCPSCPGCLLIGDQNNGHGHSDEFVLKDDRCVRCKCTMGNLVCIKRPCPVLSCPASKVVHRPKACCPECTGMREVYDWKRRCLVDNRFYAHGQTFVMDNCTRCTCNGSTSVCKRESCPPLGCLEEWQSVAQGECCPRCRSTSTSIATVNGGGESCTAADGQNRQEGETWKPDPCTTCGCWKGKSRCLVDQCKYKNKYRSKSKNKSNKSKGKNTMDSVRCLRRRGQRMQQCCPKCIEQENDGVCRVFATSDNGSGRGDRPRYQTFDGRRFQVRGSCKYLLTADCGASKSFSVRVRNDAQSGRTKSVFVQLNRTRVVLLRRTKVKVDGIRVVPPYTMSGVVSVSRHGRNTIVIRTETGMSLLWNDVEEDERDKGDGLVLQVTLRAKYKGKVCGLCGDFDGDGGDDLRTRSGRLVNGVLEFVDSWHVGGRRHCDHRTVQKQSASNWTDACRGSMDACADVFALSDAFAPCRRVVDPTSYSRRCPSSNGSMSSSSSSSCHCDALMAYTHECSRQGITLDWKTATGCTTMDNATNGQSDSTEKRKR